MWPLNTGLSVTNKKYGLYLSSVCFINETRYFSDSSIFDVCRETTKIVSDTAVYIVSPNVFQSSGPSSRQVPVCECIINSRYSDQIMVDYIHSDVYSNGNKCSDSYILLESKLVPNQTTVDKEVEVCGRRTVSNQMFRGTVRLSYYNRRSAADDGFLTKFRGMTREDILLHEAFG